MAARVKGNYEQLLQLAVAVGDVTPDPGVGGVLAWSTSQAAVVVWTGTAWTTPADFASAALDDYKLTGVTNAGTSVTLGTGTSGRATEFTSGTAVAVTLSQNAPVGFCQTVVQAGAGQITFTAGSGGAVRNRQSHTKTAGQWAAVSLYVRANAGGSAAEWVLSGDTAA